jgi:hypothetical protein
LRRRHHSRQRGLLPSLHRTRRRPRSSSTKSRKPHPFFPDTRPLPFDYDGADCSNIRSDTNDNATIFDISSHNTADRKPAHDPGDSDHNASSSDDASSVSGSNRTYDPGGNRPADNKRDRNAAVSTTLDDILVPRYELAEATHLVINAAPLLSAYDQPSLADVQHTNAVPQQVIHDIATRPPAAAASK